MIIKATLKDGTTREFHDFYDEEGMGTLVNDEDDTCISLDFAEKQIYLWHFDSGADEYIDYVKLEIE